MARKTQTNEYVRYGIIGVVVIALYSIGKVLLNRFSSGFAFLTSKKDAEKVNADLTIVSPTQVRYTFVMGVVESLKGEISAWNQSESNIVQLLNSLANREEVIQASTNYRNAYGVSLKAEVQGALDAWFNPMGWFTSSHWSALKDYVKNNLV